MVHGLPRIVGATGKGKIALRHLTAPAGFCWLDVGIRKFCLSVSGLKAKGYVRDGIVHWVLEGNELEFTVSEFREMIDDFTADGLFGYLERVRPALLSQLRNLFPDSLGTPEDEKELEYLLEQCLLGLERKVSLK